MNSSNYILQSCCSDHKIDSMKFRGRQGLGAAQRAIMEPSTRFADS